MKYHLSTDIDNRMSVARGIVAAISELPLDKAYQVEIKAETRSLAQNSYIWKVVYGTIVTFMREHYGEDYSVDAVHELFKQKFLPYRVEQLRSGEVKIYRTTTQLTKSEFSEYVEHIGRFMAESGCVIPPPEWRE